MKKISNKQWWNNLDKIWKVELIQNLLDSPKYKNRNMAITDIYELLEESDEVITDIVNLEKVHVSSDVICDFSPLSYLKKIEDFHFQLPSWKEVNASFLDLYPEHLRSKVRRLDLDGLIFEDDLSPLIDFINLEVLNCQDCQIESLEGIQKLTKLKVLNAGRDNSFSDLNPLCGLNLVSLNIQLTKVTNINPLIDLPSLEWIDLSFLNIVDLSPLLKLPNLKVVVLNDGIEIPIGELNKYLKQDHYLYANKEQNQSIAGQFDCDKNWYLIPLDPIDEFVGSLHEGSVIDNESDFKAENYKHPISCIRIADSINICSELSDPLIHQVKIEKDTHLKLDKRRGGFWYASKVEIIKSASCWDLLPTVAVFKGNIGIRHQSIIPEGLVFPKKINGNLLFYESTLPKTIKLPEIIKGNLEIIACDIPPEWAKIYPSEIGNLRIVVTRLEKGTVLPKKIYGDLDFHRLTKFEEGVTMPESYLSVTAELIDFPADFKLLNTKLKTLTFEKCKLPENFEIPEVFYIRMIFTKKKIPSGLKMPENYTGMLSFKASEIPSELKLSASFDGLLEFKNVALPADLVLPADFKGILVFRNVQIPDGFKLPSNLVGTLKISKTKIKGRLQLPSNEDYDFELDKGSNLSDFDIPDSVLPRFKQLPSWHFKEQLFEESPF